MNEPSRMPNVPEERLEHFCRAALDLLRPVSGDESVVSFVAPVLARALAQSSREVIDRLRGELQEWEEAAPPLRQLANSTLLDLGREAAGLIGRLERARTQVERVVEVLEALEDGPGRTETANEERPALLLHAKTGKVAERALAVFEQAEVSRRARQFAEAETLYDSALRLDPTLRPAYLQRGRTRSFQGQVEGAIDDLSKAIRSDPDDAVAYWWRGDALALCNRFAEAVEDYSQALRLRPDLFPARYNRASSLRQLGDTSRALLEFDELIELRPTDASLYLNRGLIHLVRGRPRRALADFRTTLRYKPDSQEARERVREAKVLLRARREHRRQSLVAAPPVPTRPELLVETPVPPKPVPKATPI